MTTQKWITLVIYIVLASAAWAYPHHLIADIALWFFGALPIVHLLEFLVVRRILQQLDPSITHHFLQTMIFGYVHWLPLKQKLESAN